MPKTRFWTSIATLRFATLAWCAVLALPGFAQARDVPQARDTLRASDTPRPREAPQPRAAPPSRDTTLGTGDNVRITVFMSPDLTTEARISPRGTIVFPLLGEIELGGLTASEAGARIADQLKRGNFIVNPQVTLAVLQARSRQVYVLGQVIRPGAYSLDEAGTRLTDILTLAGGVSATGTDIVTVVMNRSGKPEKRDVDVSEIFRSGDHSTNVQIGNGDTIFVQRAPVFYIYGEIQRAGAYRLEPNMIVMHALSLGGGLTPRGSERRIGIHRRMPGGKFARVDARITDPIQSDDIIFVSESLF